MRFAHLSDTHLGYKHLAKDEREQDFYEQFQKTIERIIEKDVDFVIHSGDLFDQSPPNIEPLKAFQDGLLRLKEAGIPMYAIAGNHDIKYIKDNVIPQILFEEEGLKILNSDNPYYYEGDILICGVPHKKKSKLDELKEDLNQLSEEAKNAKKSILVLHQGVFERYREYMEIKMDDLPDNFDYYAMGHLHNFHEKDFGKGKLVYPGSMEFVRADVKNYDMSGKGFCIVDISDNCIEVERIEIDLKRELIIESISYANLKEDLERLDKHISSLENKPLVFLEVNGKGFDIGEVREHIKKIIKDKSLHLEINSKREEDSRTKTEFEPKLLNPRTLLEKKVNEIYGDEKITNLCLDLYDMLSMGEMKNAKSLAEDFYEENYFTSDKDNALDNEANDMLNDDESDEIDDEIEISLDYFKGEEDDI